MSKPVNLGFEIALLILLAAMWGPAYALMSVGVQTIPPITLMAIRTVLATAVLLCIVAVHGVALPRSGELWSRTTLQALVNTVIPFTLIAWGTKYVDSGVVGIIQAAPPLFVFLITAIFIRHEDTTLARWLGLMIGLIGITIVITSTADFTQDVQLLAFAALVLATISYSLAAILGSRAYAKTDPLITAVCTMIMASVFLVPSSLAFDEPWALTPSVDSIVAAILLAVVSTALPFLIYFRLLKTLGAIGTSVQSYLRVPFAIAVGAIFLGEKIPIASYAGMVLILLSVYITNHGHKRPNKIAVLADAKKST